MIIKGLTVSEASKTVYINDKYQITANLITDNEDKTITYESSNPEVASVDDKGLVTALKNGTATITIKSGDYTATVEIKTNAFGTPAFSRAAHKLRVPS